MLSQSSGRAALPEWDWVCQLWVMGVLWDSKEFYP
jgi:hypothetical protein